MPHPLARLFDETRRPDSIVAMRGDIPVTFADFAAQTRILADQLRNGRVGRAALWFDDSLKFASALFACAHTGCVAIILPNANAAQDPDLAGEWDVLLSDDPSLPSTDLPPPSDNPPALSPLIDPDRCRMDFFTSGSTARPKRIPRTLGQFAREVAGIEQMWGWPADHETGPGVIHATVTHQHVYGLVFRLLWPLSAGRPFACHLSQVWESLTPHVGPGDVIISSPAHLTRLGGLGRQCQARYIFTAGAPLPAHAAADSLDCLGVVPVEIYGSTETGVIASRVADPNGHTGWTPLVDVQVHCDRDGLLCLTSPWVDGLHRASDLASIRADGSFDLRGRADRVVKVEGKRVSLEMVEAALTSLEEVSAAAAVLLTSPRQQLGAAVVLSEAGREALSRLGSFRFGLLLRNQLADRLEGMARPRRWRFVSALPMAAMGKLPSTAVAALFEDDRHG